MNLELVTVPYREGALPFEQRDGYKFNWLKPMRHPHRTKYIQVLRDNIEVARVETDEDLRPSEYITAPDIWDTVLEIQLIEVSEKHQRQGIGRAVVEHLARLYPDRHLAAFSEEADEFWSSLGWARYDHPDKDCRPLFIQLRPD